MRKTHWGVLYLGGEIQTLGRPLFDEKKCNFGQAQTCPQRGFFYFFLNIVCVKKVFGKKTERPIFC